MAKSSINFQKATAHSSKHNLRQEKPSYLLPSQYRKTNEYWRHEKSDHQIFHEELGKAKRKGGRIPKLENSRWEAVVNLNENHNLSDLQRVADHIAQKFNIIPTEISIHRDEGRVENRNGKEFPIHNYHAHLNFVTYKNSRQNWSRRHIKPSHLSRLQSEVAEILQMERGEVGSKAKRLDHKQYKTVQQQKERAQRETLSLKESQQALKEQNKQLRAALQAEKAKRPHYAQLESEKKRLDDLIMRKEIDHQEAIDQLKQVHDSIIQELREQNAMKDTIISQKEAQIVSQREEISKLESAPVPAAAQEEIDRLKEMAYISMPASRKRPFRRVKRPAKEVAAERLDRLKRMKKEIDELREENSVKSNDLTLKDRDISRQKEEIKSLEDQAASSKIHNEEQNEIYTSHIHDLESELSRIQKEKESISNRAEQHRISAQTAENRLQSLKEEYRTLRVENEEKAAQIASQSIFSKFLKKIITKLFPTQVAAGQKMKPQEIMQRLDDLLSIESKSQRNRERPYPQIKDDSSEEQVWQPKR